VWPYLGYVKNIPAELLGLFWGEHLDAYVPAGIVAALNGFEKVLCLEVWVDGVEVCGLLIVQSSVALVLWSLSDKSLEV
jgi:hypothetical protein